MVMKILHFMHKINDLWQWHSLKQQKRKYKTQLVLMVCVHIVNMNN